MAAAPKKILFFTKSSNFEHNVIKERPGKLSFAAQVLKALGPKHDLEFTFFLDAIRKGKGFIGTHSAADTLHTGETAETNTN